MAAELAIEPFVASPIQFIRLTQIHSKDDFSDYRGVNANHAEGRARVEYVRKGRLAIIE